MEASTEQGSYIAAIASLSPPLPLSFYHQEECGEIPFSVTKNPPVMSTERRSSSLGTVSPPIGCIFFLRSSPHLEQLLD